MGIINDFFKRIGLRQKQNYFPENNSINVAHEMVNKSKEKFDNYVKVEKSIEQEEEKERIKVFPHKDQVTGQIFYEIELEKDDGNTVPISIIKDTPNRETLEKIVKQISEILDVAKNMDENSSVKMQAELKEKMKSLSEVYNIDFTGSIKNMVENSVSENEKSNIISYKDLGIKLHKSVDVSRLTKEEIVQYGKMINKRLNDLNNIITPDDAYRDKESLESFMKHEENPNALSAIVSANLDNLKSNEKPLDIPTIIAFAKKMETFSNEDGMLYSSYLKLEENRVIKRLQQDISSYKDSLEDIPENISTKELADTFVDYLDTTKINSRPDGKDNVTSYMIDTLQGRGVENYIKNTAKNDLRLRTFLKNNSIECKDEASRYIDAKLACLGQVVDTPESQEYLGEITKLRDFIEETDYKDEDITEVKNFLYTVVQVEKDYIKKNYEPVLREFQKIVGQNSMEEQGNPR